MIDIAQLPAGQRKLWGLMVFGFAIAALSFAALQLYTVWSKSKAETTPFRVTVTGEGKIDARPDVGVVYTTILTTGKTPVDAEEENSKKANAVVAYFKAQAVEEKDIKTGQFSVNPQYKYFDSQPCGNGPCPPRLPPEIVGYEVRNSVTVKVRDLKKIGELLKGAVANGANDVNGPNFIIDDPESARAPARKKAIDNAKEKARVLAQDLGLKLGKIVDYSEGGGVRPYYDYAPRADGMGGGMESKAMSAPPIEAGSQDVNVNISVTYELN